MSAAPDPADIECQLAELAAYHVGLFAGAASRIAPEPPAIAHALFLLIGEAERRRREWVDTPDA